MTVKVLTSKRVALVKTELGVGWLIDSER
jgi:hypothetical protein